MPSRDPDHSDAKYQTRRGLWPAAVFAVLAAPLAAEASSIGVVVSLATGDVSLYNTGPVAAGVTFYEIESPSSSLVPMDWQPIAGRLDATGDGTFDASGSWVILSGEADEFTEGVFFGVGGILQPGGLLSLGLAWNSAGQQDLAASLVVDEAEITADVVYSPLGDYDRDGLVGVSDFTLFGATFGSTSDRRADGNGNGVVDTADYTVWRDAFQLVPIDGEPVGVVAFAAPEPGAAASVILLGSAALALRRRRQTR